MLLRKETSLDFPVHLPLFITRAFPSRTTLAGVFADPVFLEVEQRGFTLRAVETLESCVVEG